MKLKKHFNEKIEKKAFVRKVFNEIAPRYDLVNHLLSFGIDYRWRKKLIKMMSEKNPQRILDIATGTGDLAIKAAKKTTAHIDGYDIAENMLVKAKEKVERKKLSKRISFEEKDCENLGKSDVFDAVIMGFGIRNFNNTQKTLESILTALKKDGSCYILEFSTPETKFFRKLYFFYLSVFLPLIGWLFTGNRHAYLYFQKSIKGFYSGNDFLELMTKAGFSKVKQHKMTAGIASIYIGVK